MRRSVPRSAQCNNEVERQLGEVGPLGLELADGLVKRQDIVGWWLDQSHALGESDACDLPPRLRLPLHATARSSLAHREGGRSEEVTPAVPAGVMQPDERM